MPAASAAASDGETTFGDRMVVRCTCDRSSAPRWHPPAAGESISGLSGANDGGGDALDSATSSIAIVQLTTTTVTQNVSSATASFTLPPTAGDMIIVGMALWSTVGTNLPSGSVTDDHGNVYQRAGLLISGMECVGGIGAVALYFAPNIAASNDAIVVNVAPQLGSQQEITFVAGEYRGVTTLDVGTTAESANLPSPQTFDSGVTAQTSHANELVVATATTCAGFPDVVSWTDDTGFTVRTAVGPTSNFSPLILADHIASSIGSFSDQWTVSYPNATTDPGIGVIATFF